MESHLRVQDFESSRGSYGDCLAEGPIKMCVFSRKKMCKPLGYDNGREEGIKLMKLPHHHMSEERKKWWRK